jgi:glycosyltransferase involved in cell wall biosynthesis
MNETGTGRWFLCASPTLLRHGLMDMAECKTLRVAASSHPILGLLLPPEASDRPGVGSQPLHYIEHLSRAEGESLLVDLEGRTREALVFFVPVVTDELEHNLEYISFEERRASELPPDQRRLPGHRSRWKPDDFLARGYDVLEVNSFYGPGFNAFYAFRYDGDYREVVRTALHKRWGYMPWATGIGAGPFVESRRTLELPFDHYQRYRLIQQAVETLRPTGSARLRILDVGGWPGTLREFLPADQLLVVDQGMKEGVDRVADGRNLPFPDGHFDMVVTSDTLEHVPVEGRNAFLGELLRVSAGPVLVGAPFDDPAVIRAEEVVDRLITVHYGRRYPFHEEHRQNGLPDLAATQDFFQSCGCSVAALPSGYLPRWTAALSVFFLAQWRYQDQPLSRALNAWYNGHFSDADNVEPAYRHLVVAARGPLPERLLALIHPSPQEPSLAVWDEGNALLNALVDRHTEMIGAQLAEREDELMRTTVRLRAVEQAMLSWRKSIFGRLATAADHGWELARLPMRVGRYLINPKLGADALNSMVRHRQLWRRGRKLKELPELEWLLRKLELDVPVDQVTQRMGPFLTPREEAGYRSMIAPLQAAGVGSSSKVRRALDLHPAAESPPARRRILFVCGEFPNPVHGGGGRVADFIKALGVHHDVFVAAWYDRRRDHDAFVDLAPYCQGLRGLSFEDLEGGCPGKLLQLLAGQPADIVHYEWPRSLISQDRRLGRHHIYTHMESVSCSLWMDLKRMEPLSRDWLIRLAQLLTMLGVEALDAGRSDAQVVVTAKDGEFLSRFVAGQTYYVVNHGINRDEFDVPEQPAQPNTLVFTGNFVHYPNVDAVHHFMREIRPLILTAVPELRVWLVGAHPPRDIQRYHDGHQVMVTGRVPDVRPFIQKAAVCIAPLISGAGLRTKVVQYAALRRPCVASPIAAEDLTFEDGREICIAAEPGAFARRVVELLSNPVQAAEMAGRARTKALACYDNRLIAEQGLGQLYSLLDAGKEQP